MKPEEIEKAVAEINQEWRALCKRHDGGEFDEGQWRTMRQDHITRWHPYFLACEDNGHGDADLYLVNNRVWFNDEYPDMPNWRWRCPICGVNYLAYDERVPMRYRLNPNKMLEAEKDET